MQLPISDRLLLMIKLAINKRQLQLLVQREGAMFRITLMAIILVSLLAGGRVQYAQQDYTDQLIKLTELTDNQEYREAINGYKRLQTQPGAPAWLKAASQYEIAELYAELN
jgi:hypothetical protein